MNAELLAALGGGWLGKAIAVFLGGLAAWLARRPIEKAGVITAVNQQVETLLSHSAAQLKAAIERCDAVEKMHIEERERCDKQLATMRAEIAELMSGPVAIYRPRKKRPSDDGH